MSVLRFVISTSSDAVQWRHCHVAGNRVISVSLCSEPASLMSVTVVIVKSYSSIQVESRVIGSQVQVKSFSSFSQASLKYLNLRLESRVWKILYLHIVLTAVQDEIATGFSMSRDTEDNSGTLHPSSECLCWTQVMRTYSQGLKPPYMSEGDSMACSPAEETPPQQCVQRGEGEVPETASSGLSHSGRKPGLHHPAEVISDYNWTGIRQPDRLARTCPVPAIHSLFRGIQAVPFLLWTFVCFRVLLIDWGVCLFHLAYQCEAVAEH